MSKTRCDCCGLPIDDDDFPDCIQELPDCYEYICKSCREKAIKRQRAAVTSAGAGGETALSFSPAMRRAWIVRAAIALLSGKVATTKRNSRS